MLGQNAGLLVSSTLAVVIGVGQDNRASVGSSACFGFDLACSGCSSFGLQQLNTTRFFLDAQISAFEMKPPSLISPDIPSNLAA